MIKFSLDSFTSSDETLMLECKSIKFEHDGEPCFYFLGWQQHCSSFCSSSLVFTVNMKQNSQILRPSPPRITALTHSSRGVLSRGLLHFPRCRGLHSAPALRLQWHVVPLVRHSGAGRERSGPSQEDLRCLLEVTLGVCLFYSRDKILSFFLLDNKKKYIQIYYTSSLKY